MYAYLVHVNRKRRREVMVSMLGLACSILCHVVCLGMSDAEVIFYLWTTSIVIELVADVVSRLKYEQVNHDVEHHNAERLGCFTMVVLGESVIQLLLPDLELLSESSIYRYAVAGFSGALIFNLAVIHFDKLPSQVHDKSESERGASSLPPHNNKLRVLWTLLHLPMTFFMLLVGISMKYMFNNKKSSEDTVWMLGISVGAILAIFSVMRFLRQGFKGKRKRLLSYGVRFLVAVFTALVPLLMPIKDMETYWTIFPFTAITTCFVVIDMRQPFKIVEKVELTERKRVATAYQETGHLPEKYRKSVTLPPTVSIPISKDKDANGTGNIWSKLGSYTTAKEGDAQYTAKTDNPLAAIDE